MPEGPGDQRAPGGIGTRLIKQRILAALVQGCRTPFGGIRVSGCTTWCECGEWLAPTGRRTEPERLHLKRPGKGPCPGRTVAREEHLPGTSQGRFCSTPSRPIRRLRASVADGARSDFERKARGMGHEAFPGGEARMSGLPRPIRLRGRTADPGSRSARQGGRPLLSARAWSMRSGPRAGSPPACPAKPGWSKRGRHRERTRVVGRPDHTRHGDCSNSARFVPLKAIFRSQY